MATGMARIQPQFGAELGFSSASQIPSVNICDPSLTTAVRSRSRAAHQSDAMNSFRGGMQVHAVPESERAFDAAGRQLPWGYEYAE
ncbi:hypothetical protein BFW01_g11180 [Lasiodiplodia theobromae]|nr:hypothetical protein BFW01_g11180 [Lasiodiplodia theobromae]